MNDLFAALRLSDFVPLLQGYRAAGVEIRTMIDGGAAAGNATRKMLRHAHPEAICYAFEPFPGNHRFLESLGAQVVLRKEALAEQARVATFQVSSVVSADSAWGKRGLEGYSSVGFLTDTPRGGTTVLEVPCARADAIIDPARPVDFVKLDLQGGELNALRGMSGFLDQPLAMWIEYSGQPGLAEFLTEAGYLLFDTEYFGLSAEPDAETRRQFDVTRSNVTLSTGKEAWFGFKRTPWTNYPEEFAELRRRKILVQTDLVCINRRRLKEFCAMLGHLPDILGAGHLQAAASSWPAPMPPAALATATVTAPVAVPAAAPSTAASPAPSAAPVAPGAPVLPEADDPGFGPMLAPSTRTARCPICESDRTRLNGQYLQGKEIVDLFFCAECESFSSPYAKPRPVGNSTDWHLRVRERNQGYARILFAKLGMEGPTVLDIGCGIGTVIETATSQGGGGTGYELNRACVEYGRSRGLDLHCATWSLDTPVTPPTLITCIMVLEHLHQPRPLLHDLIRAGHRYKAPVFISVPWFDRRWWPYLATPVTSSVFHPLAEPGVHVSHFSRTAFERVARSFGAGPMRMIKGAGWTGYAIDPA